MPHSEEISCQDLVEVVTEYLEGTLPPTDRVRFEEHLEQCPPCRVYMEQMRQTIQALGRLPRETISGDAKHGLLKAFRNWKKDFRN